MPLTWNDLGLKDNPFASTPPSLVGDEEIVWADMADIKERLRKRLQRSIATSPCTLVLNWGPWGGGKTHAAKFFSQDTVLQEMSEEIGVSKPLSVVVNVPRSSSQVIKELYTSIVGFIGIRRISDDLKSVREVVGEEEFRELARKYTSDDDLSDALVQLSGGGGTTLSMFDDNSGPSNTLRRYFNGETTKNDIKNLGLSRNIGGANDYVKLLTAIINIITYSGGGELPLYSEFIIWIDEMEEIKSLSGREQTVLSGTIRDLTDYIPNNLSIFLNFSSAPGGEYEDLGAFLGGAVWDRVREENEFTALDYQSFETYILDLMNHPKYRDSGGNYEGLEPLSEAALREVYDLLAPSVHPRRANEMMSLTLEEFIMRKESIGERLLITSDFVESIKDELHPIAQRGRYQAM